MSTQLAYDYAATARIMSAGGYSDQETKDFLIASQNASGYILSSLIPPPKKL